jgi:hypothetical protein
MRYTGFHKNLPATIVPPPSPANFHAKPIWHYSGYNFIAWRVVAQKDPPSDSATISMPE